MKLFSSNRKFRLWDYSPSHSKLLIRAIKNDTEETNIDIIFTGVFFIEIPDLFWGIEIQEATMNESRLIEKTYKLKSEKGNNYFKIISTGKYYCIGAAYLSIDENQMDPHKRRL